MQLENLRKVDTVSWLRKSFDDLRCAQIDLAVEPPAAGDAMFHCQQTCPPRTYMLQ